MATRKAGLQMGAAFKAAAGGKSERVDLSKLRLDGGTQPRQEIDKETVATYAERMERKAGEVVDPEGKPFDPIVVYYDGESYWLADGYHRVEAARRKGWLDYPADIRQGMQRDAVAYSLGANARHGKQRTNADKRRAVARALVDREWSQLPDREIARMCAVTHPMVGKLRAELEVQRLEDERQVVTLTTFSTTEHDELEGIAQRAPGRVLKRESGGLSELRSAHESPSQLVATYQPNIIAPPSAAEPLLIPKVSNAILRDAPRGKLAGLLIREPKPLPLNRAVGEREILKPHGVIVARLHDATQPTLEGLLPDLDSGWLIRLIRVGHNSWAAIHRRGALFPNYFKDEDAMIDEILQMDGQLWELR